MEQFPTMITREPETEIHEVEDAWPSEPARRWAAAAPAEREASDDVGSQW